jgi:hypothetical protein
MSKRARDTKYNINIRVSTNAVIMIQKDSKKSFGSTRTFYVGKVKIRIKLDHRINRIKPVTTEPKEILNQFYSNLEAT